jgi:ketosteroid isomerase-like protein
VRRPGLATTAVTTGLLVLTLSGAVRNGVADSPADGVSADSRVTADNSVNADDRVTAEVKAATEAFYAALNRADAAAADKFLLPGGDSFPRSGAKLDPEATTAEESLKNLRALFASGLRFHVVIRELQVKPYGDTAVATFYTQGTTASAAGRSASQGVFRASYVWVRRPQGWQIAHFHLSPLTVD